MTKPDANSAQFVDFMQKLLDKGGSDWLRTLLPQDKTVAAVVLEQNEQDSDTVLLLVRPGNRGMRLTDISVIIGWSR